MDPLSIISSSISIAHVIRLGLRKAQQISSAKSDLLALSNEVSDLSVVLQAIEQSLRLQNHVSSIQYETHFIESLLPARAQLQLLAAEVEKWLGSDSTSPRCVEAKHFPWLRIGVKAKRLKDEVRTLRSQLVTTLAGVSAIKSSRIELDLQDVYLVTQTVASDQKQFNDFVKENHVEQLRHLEKLSTAIESLHHQSSTESHFETSASEFSSTDNYMVKAFHSNGSILSESRQMTLVSAVGIRTAHFPRMPCKPWCICVCHKETRFRTPTLLDRVIGSLFIGYSGMPIQRKKCNEQSCHVEAQPFLSATYFFPAWFLARVVSFHWTTTPMAGPVASLKVQRAVPGEAEIFKCAMTGDVHRMKYLFENGLASPHDVAHSCGLTALHIAISYEKMEACRFLLQANADPFLEDHSHWTATDNAWQHLLAQKFKPETERQLRLMFTDTDCLERRNFTTLHRIVLGLIGKDLEAELAASTADINALDANGMSALSFAAVRADETAAAILLRYGADPNLSSPTQGSPLHKAACARYPTCIPQLLAHGAHVDITTSWAQTPLHFATAWTHDPRHTTLLLAAGADPNARDRDGITPLQWAATSANTAAAAALLAHGADPHPPADLCGVDPLVQCIHANRHEILALLLDHHPLDACRALPRGESLLHVVARHADGETMRLLRRLDIAGLDVGAVAENGLTAWQVLEARGDASEELREEFKLLLGGETRMRPIDGVGVEGEEVDEVWVDAMESHFD